MCREDSTQRERGIRILPLNRVSPDSPGKKGILIKGAPAAAIQSTQKRLCRVLECQNGADLQSGTIKVPSAIQPCVCLITLGTRLTGGHHQLFLPFQSVMKVPTASEPGLQHLLLKQNNWQLSQSADQSATKHCWIQIPIIVIDCSTKKKRKSACSFNSLRIHYGSKLIWYWSASERKTLKAISCRSGFLLPTCKFRATF